ncbi:MAG: hypothetical protein ACK55Z_11045, partial [bacterium]
AQACTLCGNSNILPCSSASRTQYAARTAGVSVCDSPAVYTATTAREMTSTEGLEATFTTASQRPIRDQHTISSSLASLKRDTN